MPPAFGAANVGNNLPLTPDQARALSLTGGGVSPSPAPFQQPRDVQPVAAEYPLTSSIADWVQNATGWRPGTTPSWVPDWARNLSASNTAAEKQARQEISDATQRVTGKPMTDEDFNTLFSLGMSGGMTAPEGGFGAILPEAGGLSESAAPVGAPSIMTRANPSAGDIQSIMEAAREYGRRGWPTVERGVFKTTPEAYAETTSLVPQVSVKGQLPGPLPGETLPLKERAAPIVANTEEIANRIAERLDPMVRAGDETLKFYHTGPVIRGLQQYGDMSVSDANAFMRDWAGQGAATSPRTQTPPNLRNSSFLNYQRASGTPLTPERFAAEGNTPGFPMMGMHVNLADQFARGIENPWTNPKPFTFRENWSGNLQDVTGDTHNIRATLYNLDQIAPGSLPRGWFTSDEAYSKYRDQGFSAVDPGDIADTLESKTVKGIKRQSEYLPMTEPWYRAAEKLGVDPAEAQSGGWFSHGNITGLQSPPKTIVNLLNDQIGATAKALNVPPQKVVNWWSRGKIPLAGIAGGGFGIAAAGRQYANEQGQQ